ncbi:MAG: adenylate/guanylate cyclase domain-containing protein [Pseudohongiellaceae bacterium]
MALGHVWGDTVNTASRMESHGVANRIQVSSTFQERTRDTFRYESRGPLQIKGKGLLETYFLEGEIHPGVQQ